MMIDKRKLEVVFRKVQQVQGEIQRYCLAPERPDLSVEDFQRIVSETYKIQIQKFVVPFEGEFLRGMLERYRDKATIYVKYGQAPDMTRYIAVKEMCHIVNDEEEDWSVDGVSTLREMLTEYTLSKDEIAPKVAQSELLAELAATELLYPFKYRERDLRTLESGNTTLNKIASHHNTPAIFISRALRSDYHVLAAEIWSTILNEAERVG